MLDEHRGHLVGTTFDGLNGTRHLAALFRLCHDAEAHQLVGRRHRVVPIVAMTRLVLANVDVGHAVHREAALDRRVAAVAEHAVLEVDVVVGRSDGLGDMPARGVSAHDHARGVEMIFLGMIAKVANCRLHVIDLGRPLRMRAQTIPDACDRIALRGRLEKRRDVVRALEAELPCAAVHDNEHGEGPLALVGEHEVELLALVRIGVGNVEIGALELGHIDSLEGRLVHFFSHSNRLFSSID